MTNPLGEKRLAVASKRRRSLPVAKREKGPESKIPRTQEERRTGTIRKLLDAACDELVEVGYSGATTAKICARAGTSQGALFRHFPTRESLMVAVGEDIGSGMLESYAAAFRDATAPGRANVSDPLVGALGLVRQHCRSRKNQAFYELMVAARTDDRLKEALGPPTAAYYVAIEGLARALLPELAEALGTRFPLLVDTLLAVFDGEALHGFVLPDTERRDAPRVELLASIVRLLSVS